MNKPGICIVLSLCLLAGLIDCRADENLIRGGTFESAAELPSAEFRCPNDGRGGGRLELLVEDLSWNKCAKLTAGAAHDEKAGGRMRRVSSARMEFGGMSSAGLPVEPNMHYEYSFALKGSVKSVIFRVYEIGEVDGKEVRQRAFKDVSFAPGGDWRRCSGRFRTRATTRRVELWILMWTLLDEGPGDFAPDDFVLIDNVSFVRSERYVRLAKALDDPREHLRVAPFPVESDPACPFLPLELADPPTQIVFRAAVNEQKPLPIAIGNLTDSFAQYRVVLETVPVAKPGRNYVSDDGDFGLSGFPPEKISIREALRFKDTEDEPVTLRYDPLVGMNEASVISVPPKEAGAVWLDFDTRDVKPGVYRGRLHVTPLNCGASYASVNRQCVRKRSGEVLLPVEFTVDPIVLPREAVRPAHLCSPCVNEQGFQLEADIGTRIYAFDTHLIRPEAIGDPESAARRTIADYRRWAAARGVDVSFFVKYDALRVSQEIFNPQNVAEQKWTAWEEYVRTLARVMDEAGVGFANYYVLVRDEPFNGELTTIREAHRRLKALYPKMQTYVSVCERIAGEIDFLNCLGDSTDLWSLTSRMYGSERMLARLQALKAKRGTKLLHYLCNTSVKEPLSGYFRRHCWRGEHWGLDADMLYHFNIWQLGQYGELSFRVVPTGEISYASGGRFMPSVRYMAYREGVTDVKYVQALRNARGADPKVAEFLRRAARAVVVEDTGSVELPVRMRERIREMLLSKE